MHSSESEQRDRTIFSVDGMVNPEGEYQLNPAVYDMMLDELDRLD